MSSLCESLQTRAILAFHLDEGPAHDLALRNQHEVQAANHLALVSTETFAEEPLRPIALDGATHPPAYGEAQAPEVPRVFGGEEDEERPIEPEPLSEHLAKLWSAPDSLSGSESCVRQPASLGA